MTTLERPKLKPPFKWTGGKNRMWEKYLPVFFPEKIDTFVDMFCGASSVSLWVAHNFPDAKIVMNDANAELMALYDTMRNNYAAFEKEYLSILGMYLTLPEPKSFKDKKKQKKWNADWENNNPRKIFYYKLRDRYAFEHQSIPTERLMAELYFMMKVNFNGMWKAYAKQNYRYSTPPGTLTQKGTFFNIKETRNFSEFLNRCTLQCDDFATMSQYAGEGTYYYADPPYRDSVVEYQDTFGDDEQKRLVKTLQDYSDAGSYIAESNKEIGDNFWENNFGEDYNFNFFDAKYTAGRGTTVIETKEVLVTNFEGNAKELDREAAA